MYEMNINYFKLKVNSFVGKKEEDNFEVKKYETRIINIGRYFNVKTIYISQLIVNFPDLIANETFTRNSKKIW